MDVAGGQPATAIQRFADAPVVGAFAVGDGLQRALHAGVVVAVPAQTLAVQLDLLHGQGHQPGLHLRFARQQAEQFAALAVEVGQPLEQIEHAAALGEDRFAGRMMGADRHAHRHVAGQLLQIQLRVAARQVQAVDLRQLVVVERREEYQLGPQRAQQLEVGRVDEGKGSVASHTDAHALQQW
ncbi:hypothetical protein D3C75_709180 [compost metagenome]